MNWAGLLLLALVAASPAAARKKPAPPVAAAPLPSVKSGVELWRAGDYAGAVAAWRPYADAGDADAMFNIGQAYKLGRSVPKNETEARDWYRRAATKGHRPAQANLGILLFQAGEKTEAVRWLKVAADHNEMRAQYVLGVAYWNGDGTARSLALAYAYLSRAAALGLPEASSALASLEPKISAIDRANGTAVAISLANGDGVPPVFAGSSPILPPIGLAAAARAPRADARAASAEPAAISKTPAPIPAAAPAQVAQASPSTAPATRLVAPPSQAAVVPRVGAARVPRAPAIAVLSTPPSPVVGRADRPAAPVVTAVAIPSASVPQSVTLPAKAAASPALARAKPTPVNAPIVVANAVKPVLARKLTGWRVQLGAFSKRAMAETAWKALLAKQKKAVAGVSPIYEPNGSITKLQLGPFTNEKMARDACAKIAFGGSACFVTRG